jgi:hypothetical protein
MICIRILHRQGEIQDEEWRAFLQGEQPGSLFQDFLASTYDLLIMHYNVS